MNDPKPAVCPLCKGRGKTHPNSFKSETCRACNGKGIVWPPDFTLPSRQKGGKA